MKEAGAALELFLPLGFSFSSACAGIKVSGRPDLALIECSPRTNAAAVFTKNRVVAAPVSIGREALKTSRGRIRAVVVNSGNANCATGSQGLRACRAVCAEAARLLGTTPKQIFPSSTGIIGVSLPAEKILVQLADLIARRENTRDAAWKFAHTIMTTDTRPKVASKSFRTRSGEFRLLGIAKGSGMIHPQLATMLVYLLTDAQATPLQLKRVLAGVCDQTFNCISIDGDTSTNDTVLLLASGQSRMNLKARHAAKIFTKALSDICQSLCEQIVRDGEGVQHVIRLSIEGAKNRAEAMQVAEAIAHSLLTKTAWAGADPNWGRILAAAGRSGVSVNPARISIFIGQQKVCQRGQAFAFDEKTAHEDLSRPTCEVRVQLGRGRTRLRFLTTDLTSEYVRINADYST
jgi:glutamate N-acetyltransferase / amino-acid N-acetyltransferase